MTNHTINLKNISHSVLDIHAVCNQTCEYCISGSNPTKEFGKFITNDMQKTLIEFYSDQKEWNIIFTGGEPLITPNIGNFFRKLISKNNKISIQTNLKSNADVIINYLKPSDMGWILTTFHSCEMDNYEKYKKQVLRLKKGGYPIVVKLVVDEKMMNIFDKYYDELTALNIGVILSPLVVYKENELLPINYPTEIWKKIIKRISLLSSWLYFSGGFKSKGKKCLAGSKATYVRVWGDGKVSGCAHSFPKNLGSFIDGNVKYMNDYAECGLDDCFCDFNYYIDIIDGLKDMNNFQKLFYSPGKLVFYEDFLLWCDNANITPKINLKKITGIL